MTAYFQHEIQYHDFYIDCEIRQQDKMEDCIPKKKLNIKNRQI